MIYEFSSKYIVNSSNDMHNPYKDSSALIDSHADMFVDLHASLLIVNPLSLSGEIVFRCKNFIKFRKENHLIFSFAYE